MDLLKRKKRWFPQIDKWKLKWRHGGALVFQSKRQANQITFISPDWSVALPCSVCSLHLVLANCVENEKVKNIILALSLHDIAETGYLRKTRVVPTACSHFDESRSWLRGQFLPTGADVVGVIWVDCSLSANKVPIRRKILSISFLEDYTLNILLLASFHEIWGC